MDIVELWRRALAVGLEWAYLLKNLGMRRPSCRDVLPKVVMPPFWRGVEMWGFMKAERGGFRGQSVEVASCCMIRSIWRHRSDLLPHGRHPLRNEDTVLADASQMWRSRLWR